MPQADGLLRRLGRLTCSRVTYSLAEAASQNASPMRRAGTGVQVRVPLPGNLTQSVHTAACLPRAGRRTYVFRPPLIFRRLPNEFVLTLVLRGHVGTRRNLLSDHVIDGGHHEGTDLVEGYGGSFGDRGVVGVVA